jgi:hypothetical protein
MVYRNEIPGLLVSDPKEFITKDPFWANNGALPAGPMPLALAPAPLRLIRLWPVCRRPYLCR